MAAGSQCGRQSNHAGFHARRWLRPVLLFLVVALVATACRVGGNETIERSAERPTQQPADSSDQGPLNEPSLGEPALGEPTLDEEPAPTAEPSTTPTIELPRNLDASSIDCSVPTPGTTASLNDLGRAILLSYVESGVALPAYQLVVDINPQTGDVAAAMRAEIPAQDRTIKFRVFAGMEAFASGLTITDVHVDGEPVDAKLDRALLSVPAPLVGGRSTVVELSFRFTIDQMAANPNIFGALSGESLQPDQVGLLGRTETGMQLGHWFPVWLPDGVRADANPAGFGDIGAFPAANICASITVPPGYQVVTGGTRVATTAASVVEAGAGLRDFSLLISNDLLLAARFVDGVEVRVWGPTNDPESLKNVLDYADQSLTTLTAAFGPYPWKEIDIISAPLGAGVGGMEWPGAIWIEQSLFAGAIAGLGDLGDAFGDEDLSGLLAGLGGVALTTSLEWTVAHELGHEWWHAIVGNDSIASPAVDEPLAQFSACLAMQSIHPENWREICDAQTVDQFAQARALGISDTTAEQPSDAFDSSLQYGAVVYGKAPGFYFAAADVLGWEELIDALRSFVEKNAFALVSTDALRSHLIDAAGSDGQQVADLWDRWFREVQGDQDIDVTTQLDAFADLGTFGDIDLEALFGDDLDLGDLESLFGDDLDLGDLESLFGDDLDLGDLEELLRDDLDITELLTDALEAIEALEDD